MEVTIKFSNRREAYKTLASALNALHDGADEHVSLVYTKKNGMDKNTYLTVKNGFITDTYPKENEQDDYYLNLFTKEYKEHFELP